MAYRSLLDGPETVSRIFGVGNLQADEGANDSDKTFTVPAERIWVISSIWVELVSTATAGNRQMALEIQDASNDVVAEIRAGAVQAASLTRKYLFSVTAVDLIGFRDTDWLSTPLPYLLLPAGFQVRVFDNNAVDAAADDMVVQMMVTELKEI